MENDSAKVDELLKAEAARWVIKVNAGELSAKDAIALENWLHQSDAHSHAFQQHARVWLDAGNLFQQAPVKRKALITRSLPSRWALFDRPSRWTGAVAASVVLILSIGFVYTPWGSVPMEHSVAQTVVGEKRQLIYSDGTVVELNTDTEIASHYSKSERVVKLIKGEAHFEVARDRSRPFRVYAGLNVIEAVGTAFRVRMTEATEVIVTEGQVKLITLQKASDELSDPLVQSALTDETLLVGAGRNAIFREERVVVEKVDDSTIAKRLSWKDGMLLFDGDSLAAAVTEFERYTETDITVDDNIKNMRIVGYFNAGDTDRFLKALDESFDIASQEETPGNVRLYLRDETTNTTMKRL